jgi:hypothetical protein
MLTPLLQILGAVLVWRKRQHIKVWGVLLTVLLNLAVVTLLLRFSLTRITLPSLIVFNPDVGYALVIVLALGTGWSLIFTTMYLMRRRSA